MKICMVVPEADVKGGIASVVNGYREYDFGSQYEISYVESYRDGSKWQKLFKALKGYYLFQKEIRKNKPDIVHVHSSFGPSFYRKIPFIYMAYLKKIPVVNHIHGADFDTFYLKASSEKKKLIQRVYGKCRILIALSEEWKANLGHIVSSKKVIILENYCQIPEMPKQEVSKQILFMGEIGDRKGCLNIPGILEKAFASAGKTKVVIAGDGTPSKVKELKELMAQKRLSDTVSFPGWVRGEAKDRLLRESGIFLFPSYQEGMPMVVLEAMAYGMAIVTTNVGGIPGLIEDSVSGYLCEPENTQQIAERLTELLLDETKRQAFGKTARETAKKRYGMDGHIRKLLKIYERALLGRTKNGA